ncbi:uncharacterized protein LOC128890376 [Hylaeus anthracinus]|uniref:uncharacterized protein LOC128890376 n=1 Tax=Hylaeus anthracinus TaxID=313031 RepID=UPI0023BA3289|nr:uncharacterized protein LOC128890376 [Hylaeus anthracinus]
MTDELLHGRYKADDALVDTPCASNNGGFDFDECDVFVDTIKPFLGPRLENRIQSGLDAFVSNPNRFPCVNKCLDEVAAWFDYLDSFCESAKNTNVREEMIKKAIDYLVKNGLVTHLAGPGVLNNGVNGTACQELDSLEQDVSKSAKVLEFINEKDYWSCQNCTNTTAVYTSLKPAPRVNTRICKRTIENYSSDLEVEVGSIAKGSRGRSNIRRRHRNRHVCGQRTQRSINTGPSKTPAYQLIPECTLGSSHIFPAPPSRNAVRFDEMGAQPGSVSSEKKHTTMSCGCSQTIPRRTSKLKVIVHKTTNTSSSMIPNSSKLTSLSIPCKPSHLIVRLFEADPSLSDSCLILMKRKFENSIRNACSCLNDILKRLDDAAIKELRLGCEIRSGRIDLNLRRPRTSKNRLFLARLPTCRTFHKRDAHRRAVDECSQVQISEFLLSKDSEVSVYCKDAARIVEKDGEGEKQRVTFYSPCSNNSLTEESERKERREKDSYVRMMSQKEIDFLWSRKVAERGRKEVDFVLPPCVTRVQENENSGVSGDEESTQDEEGCKFRNSVAFLGRKEEQGRGCREPCQTKQVGNQSHEEACDCVFRNPHFSLETREVEEPCHHRPFYTQLPKEVRDSRKSHFSLETRERQDRELEEPGHHQSFEFQLHKEICSARNPLSLERREEEYTRLAELRTIDRDDTKETCVNQANADVKAGSSDSNCGCCTDSLKEDSPKEVCSPQQCFCHVFCPDNTELGGNSEGADGEELENLEVSRVESARYCRSREDTSKSNGEDILKARGVFQTESSVQMKGDVLETTSRLERNSFRENELQTKDDDLVKKNISEKHEEYSFDSVCPSTSNITDTKCSCCGKELSDSEVIDSEPENFIGVESDKTVPNINGLDASSLRLEEKKEEDSKFQASTCTPSSANVDGVSNRGPLRTFVLKGSPGKRPEIDDSNRRAVSTSRVNTEPLTRRSDPSSGRESYSERLPSPKLKSKHSTRFRARQPSCSTKNLKGLDVKTKEDTVGDRKSKEENDLPAFSRYRSRFWRGSIVPGNLWSFPTASIDRMKHLIRKKLRRLLLEERDKGTSTSKTFLKNERYLVSISSGKLNEARRSCPADSCSNRCPFTARNRARMDEPVETFAESEGRKKGRKNDVEEDSVEKRCQRIDVQGDNDALRHLGQKRDCRSSDRRASINERTASAVAEPRTRIRKAFGGNGSSGRRSLGSTQLLFAKDDMRRCSGDVSSQQMADGRFRRQFNGDFDFKRSSRRPRDYCGCEGINRNASCNAEDGLRFDELGSFEKRLLYCRGNRDEDFAEFLVDYERCMSDLSADFRAKLLQYVALCKSVKDSLIKRLRSDDVSEVSSSSV